MSGFSGENNWGHPPPDPVRRELSDAYLDSLSRTPRYERCNTYDEMLDKVAEGDPFHGEYKPSDKPKRSHHHRGKKKHETTSDNVDSSIPGQLGDDSPRKKHKKKKKKEASPTREITLEGKVNPLFKVVEKDAVSVKSTGTYVLEKENLGDIPSVPKPPSSIQETAKIVPMPSSSTSQVASGLGRRRTKLGIDKIGLSRFIKEKKICQKVLLDKTDFCEQPGSAKSSWGLSLLASVFTFSSPKDPKGNWSSYTRKVPCDSFGEIQFHGYGHDLDCSPYIRISEDTELEVVWEILVKHWNLEIPKLLISVTGGARQFDMKPRLRKRVMRGLMKASTSTGAWIITGGTNSGVREFVGQAVRDHIITYGTRDNVVCLGIPSWGALKNRHVLEGVGASRLSGLFPAVYSQQDVAKIPGREIPLDHNHTHFIMIDDDSIGNHNSQGSFKANLEQFIGSQVYMPTANSKCQDVNVPVVTIMIEGGIASIINIYECINRKTPVLVLEGSGRACDYVAYAYKLTEDLSNDDLSIIPSGFDDKMTQLAETMFIWNPKDMPTKAANIARCIKYLKEILANRRLLTVFNIKETDNVDLDQSILIALLKANKSNTNAQLSLALAWNRCDVAENEIFTSENKKIWQDMSLNDAMLVALVQDKSNFVKLFMENGLELSDFLDVKNLWNLYANCLQVDTDGAATLLHNLVMYIKQPWGSYLCCKSVEDDFIQQPDLLRLIGKAIVHLLGDESQNKYPSDSARKFDVYGCDCKLEYIEDTEVKESLTTVERRKTMMCDFEFPQKELFIWALLLNRKDMAYLFWKLTPNCLGGALFASSLLKALSKLAAQEEDPDLADNLLENSQFFEKLAIGVLSECYEKDKLTSQILLVRRLELFGNTTLFMLANSNELMDFMGHICCQTKLNHIWKGRMALHTSSLRIVICLLFPFLIPTLKFAMSEPTESQKESDNYDETKTDTNHALKSKVSPAPATKGDNILTKMKLHKVRCSRCTADGGISLVYAMYYYYTAPVTVFLTNVIAYMVYLGIFSYFLMTDLYPYSGSGSISVIEYITWGWTLTLVLEEGRQLLCRDQLSLLFKLKNWLDNIWNRFDLFLYLFFVISVVLRLMLEARYFIWARITYSITLLLLYLRFMQSFFAAKNLGPKVIMIRNMLTDLLFFFMILALFMLSFGITYQINLFPNAPGTWNLVKQILYFPYFQMFGELFLENMQAMEPGSCSNNETEWRYGGAQQCPEYNPIVPLLTAIYLLVTNILLVNLLIAMFSHTFQKVQDNSEKVWKFHRFSLVFEYYDRPTLVPPFIILSLLCRVCRWFIWRFCGCFGYHSDMELWLEKGSIDSERLNLFEKEGMEEYRQIARKQDREKIHTKVAATSDRLEKVIEELSNIKDHMKQQNSGSLMDYTTGAVTLPKQTPVNSSGPDSSRYQIDKLAGQVKNQTTALLDTNKRLDAMSITMAKLEKLLTERLVGPIGNVEEDL